MIKIFSTIQNTSIAHAQSTDYKLPLPDVTDPSKIDLAKIEAYVNTVITMALDLAGIICLVLVMYSAMMYALAYGDESKVETAKKTMTWAIIGLIIVGFSRFIVSFVENQLTNGPIP